jgi:threonine synthase
VRRGVLARFGDRLPLTGRTPALTLGEGDTPLVAAPRLAREIGCKSLWLKFEGQNPTGSFKDRGMVMAIAKAVEDGATAAVCASTGNTSASAAAYCAAIGIACRVVVPDGKVALGKLAQAVAHGARIVILRGNFDQALVAVRAIAEKTGIALVNSVNPYRIEGQKTAAFEILETLGHAPDGLALPVGNAGTITAYWKGFREAGVKPVLYGIQAAGAAPLVSGVPVEHPETLATAIRIGNPASWAGAVAARTESGGLFDKVTDEQIIEAYRMLAAGAGVFCEPASAAPVAGLLQLSRAQPGRFAGQELVAVLTGHGLKDPQTAIASAPALGAPVAREDLEEALR